MQDFLDNNQLEQAKIIQEERELEETLNTSYPTWPVNFKVEIFSTLLVSLVAALPAVMIQGLLLGLKMIIGKL